MKRPWWTWVLFLFAGLMLVTSVMNDDTISAAAWGFAVGGWIVLLFFWLPSLRRMDES